MPSFPVMASLSESEIDSPDDTPGLFNFTLFLITFFNPALYKKGCNWLIRAYQKINQTQHAIF